MGHHPAALQSDAVGLQRNARAVITHSHRWLRLGAIVLSCVIGLGVLEVGLGYVLPQPTGYFVWRPGLTALFEPDPSVMPGVSRTARLWVNSRGLRSREWGEDRAGEYRILAVGGSTTECLYLDQDYTWPSLLEKNLSTTEDGRRVWVGNAGRSGLNSRDHLAFVQLALPQYDVDAVIVLAGINDLILRLAQGPQYEPNFTEDRQRFLIWAKSRFAVAPGAGASPGEPLLKGTNLWHAARAINDQYRAIQTQLSGNWPVQDDHGRWYADARSKRAQARIRAELPPIDEALAEFRRNLREIAQTVRAAGARIVFLTSPSIYRSGLTEAEQALLWLGHSEAQGEYYSVSALSEGLHLYNETTLGLCVDLGIECFDLAARVPKTTDAFYDDVHFNERGAELVAEELAAWLRARAPFRLGGSL